MGRATQRAVENFPISGQRVERAIIQAHALIKRTCAQVNGELGVIDEGVADVIASAADESRTART